MGAFDCAAADMRHGK